MHNFILKVHFLLAASMVFLLEYTVMLLLITSAKVRPTRVYMSEISSILLQFCNSSSNLLNSPQFAAQEKSATLKECKKHKTGHLIRALLDTCSEFDKKKTEVTVGCR